MTNLEVEHERELRELCYGRVLVGSKENGSGVVACHFGVVDDDDDWSWENKVATGDGRQTVDGRNHADPSL